MESKSPQKKATNAPNAPSVQKQGSTTSEAAGFNKILQERTDWQDQHIERFLELPLVDPSTHKVSSRQKLMYETNNLNSVGLARCLSGGLPAD